MSVPHPIPYQGSKRNLASEILRFFPPDVERLIEPFAGSAALSLAAAKRHQNFHFLLNDLNAPLMALWDRILHKPETLAKYYTLLWQAQQGRERRFYDLVRERFNRTKQPYTLLYLLARCVKASVRYNALGEFNQSPDNRRKGRQPNAMRRDILAASALLHGRTQLMSVDYRHILTLAQAKDLVYLDPPYQGVCAARDPRYIESIDYEDFIKALADLNQRKIAYIVSYDGRTGTKKFGIPLPTWLDLQHVELDAGRSSQATLLGRNEQTIESLYLSPGLLERLPTITDDTVASRQLVLF